MAIFSNAGTKVYIATGSNATGEKADASAYGALTWTEIKEVETIGDFGDSGSLVSFSAVGDARVRKRRGAFDAGNLSLTVGRDPLDAGQVAARAALTSKFINNFKVALDDKADANDTPTTIYFGAYVTEAPNSLGGNDAIMKQTFQLAITTAITEVVAAVVP